MLFRRRRRVRPGGGSAFRRWLHRPEVGDLAGAVGLYTIFALVVTWPLITCLDTALAGDARSDSWKHAWGFWWFADSFRETGNFFPTSTRWLGFPEGGSLYNIDPLNSILSLPLQPFFSLTTTFNLVVLANLVAGGTAAYILARRVTGDSVAALPCGVIYAFCPFVLSYSLASGVTETLSLLWLPLCVRLLLDLPARGWQAPALAGAAIGFTAVACWYYGIFALVWTAVWVAWWLVSSRLAPREPVDRPPPPLLRLGTSLLILVIAFANVALPVFIAFSMTLKNPDSLHPRYVSERRAASLPEYLGKRFHNAARLTDFIAVGKGSAVVTSETDRLVRSATVGFTVLVLALVGSLRAGPPTRSLWVVSAGLFAILAMGPYWALDHTSEQSFSNPVYQAFYLAFPAFTQIAIPFRFCVPLMLSIGVLASLGLQRVTAGWSERMRLLASLGVTVLILLEFVLVSPAPHPLPVASTEVPEAYRSLPQMQSARAVLDLPMDWYDEGKLLPGMYFFYQADIHRKPIPYRVSGIISESVAENALVGYVRVLSLGLPLEQRPSHEFLKEGASQLYQMGLDLVVLHRNLIQPRFRRAVDGELEATLGPPLRRTAEHAVYLLPAAP